MKIDIITIFPEMFARVFDSGMIRQAGKKGLLEINIVDLRDFADDRHRTVDGRPFGGGEGMVLKAEPIIRALENLAEKAKEKIHVLLMSPQGIRFDQSKAKELSLMAHLTLICGRYEGIDQRIADFFTDEEISIGDFVLTGGEFATIVIVDAVSRLIPGVLGDGESVLRESFMDGMLDHPQYTRPAELRGMKVPEILLSGDHKEIEAWRTEQAALATRGKRPDLLEEPGADVD
ncbi:MAG: tRNA (guanosine(37)-N1)-methyltransferase TrmD [Acidobacteriota bacterium]